MDIVFGFCEPHLHAKEWLEDEMAFDGKEFRGPGGVNVAECLRVADAVERSATFTMDNAYHMCGSPGCIIGHTMGAAGLTSGLQFFGAHTALGLSVEAGRDLFMPRLSVAHYEATDEEDRGFITNAHAAACLRKLAATGEVDWLGTKPAA